MYVMHKPNLENKKQNKTKKFGFSFQLPFSEKTLFQSKDLNWILLCLVLLLLCVQV